MKKLSVVEFAENRMYEADRQGEGDHIVSYWRAYLDGALAQKKECEAELLELFAALDELEKLVDELADMCGVKESE